VYVCVYVCSCALLLLCLYSYWLFYINSVFYSALSLLCLLYIYIYVYILCVFYYVFYLMLLFVLYVPICICLLCTIMCGFDVYYLLFAGIHYCYLLFGYLLFIVKYYNTIWYHLNVFMYLLLLIQASTDKTGRISGKEAIYKIYIYIYIFIFIFIFIYCFIYYYYFVMFCLI